MKAVQYSEFGSPEKGDVEFAAKLKMVEVDKPSSAAPSSPGKGYAVVKVKAVSGNPIDCKVFFGYLRGAWDCPLPFGVGYDFSGTIDSIVVDDDEGDGGKSKFKAGDDVFGVHWGRGDHGKMDADGEPIGSTFAEYVKIPVGQLSAKPSGLSHEKAAAVALVGTTAYQALFECLKVERGTRLLVLGGPTAVGRLAVQMAKNVGAWVATTASTRNLEDIRRYEADLVIDYREKDWAKDFPDQLKDVDCVFDAVGEKEAFERSTKNPIIKQGGRFVSIANADGCGYDPNAHLPRLSFGSFLCLSNDADVQDRLATMVVNGKLVVDIDKTYEEFTLSDVVDMFKYMNGGTSNGKNVMLVS